MILTGSRIFDRIRLPYFSITEQKKGDSFLSPCYAARTGIEPMILP